LRVDRTWRRWCGVAGGSGERRHAKAIFHYVPLHDSPAGRRYGGADGDMVVINDLSSRLIRPPMWVGL
jgi:hypothetical protein